MAEIVYSIFRYLARAFSRSSFYRLIGYRTEIVIAMINRSSNKVLIAKSHYGMWMLPQEGVMARETFEEAVFRCAKVECGISISNNLIEREKTFNIRSINYVGKIKLPNTRYNERPVFDDAPGTLFGWIPLRGKAYWLAKILFKGDLNNLEPDGSELIKLQWLTESEALKKCGATNHIEKRELLKKMIEFAFRDEKPKKRY